MFFVLFWILTLFAALLFVALTAALSGRLKRWRLSIIIPCLIAFIIFALGSFHTFIVYTLRSMNLEPGWLFGYLLFLTIVFTVSSIYMLIKGLRRHKDSVAISMSWSRAKIAAIFILILIFQGLLLWNEDKKMVVMLKEAKAEAAVYAEALTPLKPADDQNAAPIYKEAMVEFDGGMPQWLYQHLTPEIDADLSTEEVREFLEEKKTALAQIEEATSMPYYYDPLPLSLFKETSYKLISNYRFAVYTLVLRARLNTSKGRIEAALEDIKTIDGMTEDISSRATITDLLMISHSKNISRSNLEYMLALSDELKPINALSIINERDYIYDSTLYAMEMGLISFMYNLLFDEEEYRQFVEESGFDIDLDMMTSLQLSLNRGIGAFYRIFLIPDELAFIREKRKELRQLRGRPLHEIKDITEDWKDFEDEVSGGILSTLAIDHYPTYISRAIGAQANQRLSNLALAATAYKADKGRYPASLDELKDKYMTEIPVDPFNGEPIKVRHIEGGMVIYSYGENKADDKGGKDDITFSLGKAYFDKFKEEQQNKIQ